MLDLTELSDRRVRAIFFVRLINIPVAVYSFVKVFKEAQRRGGLMLEQNARNN